MWGEPSEAEQLKLTKSQLQACRDWAEAVEKENGSLKETLEDWKELFFLLKDDYSLLENFQTNEWLVKARKMGIKL